MSNESNKLYEFDEYVLNAKERNLWRGKEHIPMPAKVFDTLLLLVERQGEVVFKQEMLEIIWEGAFVEENNLSQKISILRKIFGPESDFIQTVPKQGFRFVQKVKTIPLEIGVPSRVGANVILPVNGSGNGNGNGSQPLASGFEKSFVHKEIVAVDVPQKTEISNPKVYRTVFFSAMAILLLASTGFLAYSYFSYEPTTGGTIPLASFDYIELTDTGDVNFSAISPDGNFIAFTKGSPDKSDDKRTLHLMDSASRNVVEIPVNGDVIPGIVRFSPDAKTIFFRTDTKLNAFGDIYRVSILGGKPELIAKDIYGWFTISPNGKQITYFKRDIAGTNLNIVGRDIEDGVEEDYSGPMERVEVNSRGAPAFSPNQKFLAFITPKLNSETGKISVIDLENKSVQIIDTTLYSIGEIAWNPDGKSFFIIGLNLGKNFQIWNVSFPDGKVKRVTSDADSYRSLSIANDGSILVNRVNVNSNIWFVPEGNIAKAERLTTGANEIGGLLTTTFMPDGETILYNARDDEGAGIRAFNLTTKTSKRLTEKQLRTEQYFAFAPKRQTMFFGFENQIWQRSFDGSGERKMEIGDALQIMNPTVSFDEEWIFYVKRNENSTSIWKSPIEGGAEELVFDADTFSPETLLSASPDGKYLAFDYLTPSQKNSGVVSRNTRTFGLFDLETRQLKLIEVPAYNPAFRWANGGKAIDFVKYTPTGTAIFRKEIESDADPKKILELEKEMIYRFDWSPDGKDLVIGRGNHRTDLAILRSSEEKTGN